LATGDAYGNHIGTLDTHHLSFVSWTNSAGGLVNEAIYGNTAGDNIIDNGVGNIIRQESSNYRDSYVLARRSVDDPIFDTNAGAEHADLQPSIAVVRTTGAWKYLLYTKKFRVLKNDIIGFYTETMADFTDSPVPLEPGYRVQVDFYDSVGADVDVQRAVGIIDPDDGDNYASSTIVTDTGNIASTSSDQDTAYLMIADSNIQWCRVRVLSSGTYATKSTAREIVVFLRRSASDFDIRHMVDDSMIKLEAVTAVPTEGFAPLGYSIIDTTGVTHTVSRSADTTLADPAVAAATTIVIVGNHGIADGDIVGILNDDMIVTDWRTVNSAAGAPSFTLTGGGLTGDCAAGNRVVFMKWV
jgi:hypothetical protein